MVTAALFVTAKLQGRDWSTPILLRSDSLSPQAFKVTPLFESYNTAAAMSSLPFKLPALRRVHLDKMASRRPAISA
jgi:hypothetical protein